MRGSEEAAGFEALLACADTGPVQGATCDATEEHTQATQPTESAEGVTPEHDEEPVRSTQDGDSDIEASRPEQTAETQEPPDKSPGEGVHQEAEAAGDQRILASAIGAEKTDSDSVTADPKNSGEALPEALAARAPTETRRVQVAEGETVQTEQTPEPTRTGREPSSVEGIGRERSVEAQERTSNTEVPAEPPKAGDGAGQEAEKGVFAATQQAEAPEVQNRSKAAANQQPANGTTHSRSADQAEAREPEVPVRSVQPDDPDTGRKAQLERRDGRAARMRVAEAAPGVPRAESASRTTTEEMLPSETGRITNRAEFIEGIIRQSRLIRRPDGSAEIRIDLRPPELGAVSVRLSLRNDRLHAELQVDDRSVRDAVGQLMQRVREALAEEGIDLERFDIGLRRHPQQRFGRQGHGGRDGNGDETGAGDSGDPDSADAARQARETSIPALTAAVMDFFA